MAVSRTGAIPGTTVPTVAERARSIVERGGSATVLPSTGAGRTAPLLHHVTASGDAVLLLPQESPVVEAVCAAQRRELPAMLEVTDPAPVALREPVRGLLWITGWLLPLDDDAARAAALEIADRRPDPRLLDVGHSVVVLRLRAASLVLADAEGTASLRPDEFRDAEPDPFCLLEGHWLRHLSDRHPDVVAQLLRHVPADVRCRGVGVRPLGLDRFGLRLRIERSDGERYDTDVRVRFSRPVANVRQLGQEIRTLLGCPFLRSQRA